MGVGRLFFFLRLTIRTGGIASRCNVVCTLQRAGPDSARLLCCSANRVRGASARPDGCTRVRGPSLAASAGGAPRNSCAGPGAPVLSANRSAAAKKL